MKKSTIKLIAMLLCLAMIGSYLPMAAHAEEEATVYTLYPTPHSVEYGDGSFELADLNVLYDEGIDEYTKARLEETAALLGLSVTEAEDANVYVGIYGSGDAAESYILENYDVDVSLFEKIDANFVAVNNGEIVVLGKDTDSAFYGLTTLYQIFGQLGGKSIRNLTINDYADVVSRGFIEGYYGNPWSVEDRAALMTWGGYYKLNSYFYAPKDDPKHNAKWRELYTEEELETLIRPLAEAGNASKCRYVFALHPYMHNAIRHDTEEHYQEDLGIMQAKFAQVISVGVRQIAILADDAAVLSNKNNYTRMLNDMTDWLKEMQETYPDLKLTLPFVAPGFEYAGYGQSYYRDFPENVQIVMTGGQVWGYVTQNFVDRFYSTVGRGPYMWINWPCTDNSKNHLIMGGYADWLYPGVSPEKIQGIVLNPMQQSEPSKVAIFGNACYSWNIWETRDEADAAWEASFACVNHKSVVPNDASEAFKELSKHMINQAMTNGVVNLQESVAIRTELSDFRTALNTETYTQDAIASLREEFEILQNAAKVFRAEGDQRIVNQIVYWMDCWDDTTTAAIAYLDALSAILSGAPESEVWGHYAVGQTAWENSRTHALWYMDHYEYAEVGVQHIVPFMKALHSYLSTYVLDIVDPSGGLSSGGSGTGGGELTLSAFDGNKPGYYQNYYLSNVVDGNPSTAVWYSDVAQANQYIGVDLGKAVKLGTVTFMQDAGDRFVSYELQYSTDGTNYTTYNTYTDAVLNVDLAADGIVARYVRFIGSNSNGKWVKIYEIDVTEAPSTGVLTNREDLESFTTSILADRAEVVTTGSITLAPGEYLGMDLGRIKDLASIEVAEQAGLTLQVSVNNVDWVDVEAGEITEDGRYVRLINLTDADITTELNTFVVTSVEYSGPYLLESNIGINSSWGVSEDSRENGAAFDGDVNSTTEFGDFVTEGQYIIYDLGQERDIYKLEIYCTDSAVNYIRDAEMQISNDLENWTTVLTIGDGVENVGEDSISCINSDAGYSQATSSYPNRVSIEGELDEAQTARYLRILMTANNRERAVVFNEIEINNGEYVSVSNDPTFEVSAIEVQGYPPQNMVDGDLTTSWKPNTTEAGSMVYTFSDNLTLNRINIVSKVASGAKVYLLAENDGERAWIYMGLLDKSLVTLACQNDLNLALKIEWDANSVPNITEIVRFSVEVSCEHEFGEWTVIAEPTCTETGVEQRTCELCGETESRAIAALGHTEEIIPAVEATCTETGLTEGVKCSVCGEILVAQEVVPAKGHEYTAVVTAPTCTRGGYTTWTCACGDSYVDSYVEPTGHNYEDGVCTNCGHKENGEEPVEPVNPFVDVPEDGFYYESVLWAVENGITTGTTETTFDPNGKCQRAQVVTFLWRAKGCPEPTTTENPFTDVKESDFFYKAVLWAVENGITNGTSDTEFSPYAECNRAAVVTFLYRAMGEPAVEGVENPFTDVVATAWYGPAVLWAVENGITNGISATEFGVNTTCNRAQVVTFLYRTMA